MFKKCLENHIIHRSTSYKCYLCHYETPDNHFKWMSDHIETDKHKQNLNKVDETARKNESEKLSTISEVQRRIIVENYVTYTIIRNQSNKFYSLHCYICKCPISGLSNALQHVKGNSHKQLFKEIVDKQLLKEVDKKVTTSKSGKELKLSNYDAKIADKNECITYDDKRNVYFCNICRCEIPGYAKNVLEHTKGYMHDLCLKAKNSKNTKSFDSLLNKENSSFKNNFFNYNSVSNFVKVRHCTPCQMYIISDTVLKFHCMIHLFRELQELKNVDIIKFNFDKHTNRVTMKCLLCNALLRSELELEEHLTTQKHLDRLDLLVCGKNSSDLNSMISIEVESKLKSLLFKPIKSLSIASFCNLCEVSMSEKSICDHSGGKRHLNNLEKCIDKPGKKRKDMIATDFYICFICEKSFPEVDHLFRHYKKIEHNLKMKNFSTIYNCSEIKFTSINNKEVIKCNLCKVNLFACVNAIDHLEGKKHRASLQKKHDNQSSLDSSENASVVNDHLYCGISGSNQEPCPSNKNEPSQFINDIKIHTNSKASTSKNLKKNKEFETSPDELIKLGFSVESVHSLPSSEFNSLQVDDVLNDLVQLDLNKKQEKRLPRFVKQRKPRTPNTELKKNSPFNQNVSEFGKSFITLCINSGKENIYETDPEKLRLMKLGINLTFILENERVCLPCTQQFSNDKQTLFEHLNNYDHIKNLQEMEVNDKEFEDYPDQFSDLKLAKSFMIDESDDCIHCLACNIKITNDNDHVCLHISSPSHITKIESWKQLSEKIYKEFLFLYENIWYYAQVFICEVCNNAKFDFEIEFVKHLEKSKHREAVNVLKHKGIITDFNVCPICITYWYGNSKTYSKHCESSFHKRFAKNGDFMVPDMTKTALDLLKNIDEKIDFLKQESNKVLLENDKELELLNAIEENVKHIYPNAKAYTFGSRLSKLGFPDSDIDVFLDCEDVYYKSTSQEKSQQYLLSVKENFETKQDTWIVDEILLVSRVPIMKLRHLPTGLKCDISFINGLSVEKSTLIRQYNAAYPVCRELILYLKRWLTLCQLTGSDCITTFAISWCVIFYLQIKGILPSVDKLIKLKNQSKILNGWECGFQEKIPISSSDLNFKDHLEGFFSYFADFDYQTQVICPYLGKTIHKSSFAYIDQLPDEMETYKSRMSKGDLEIFRFDSPMCIQDPIDLSQNITKAVKKLKLRCFKQYCSESAAKIIGSKIVL